MAKRSAAVDSVMQPAAKKQKGAKPLAALPPSKDDKRVTSTSWVDGKDRITATTHAACKGKGCKDCGGWGFTKQIDAQLPL